MNILARSTVVAIGLAILSSCQTTSDGGASSTTAAPAAVAPVSNTNLFAKASAIADVCLKKMPDWQAVRAGFEELGFASREGTSKVYIHESDGFRIVGAVSRPHTGSTKCIVVVRNMTPEQAQKLAQPLLSATNAVPSEEILVGMNKVWSGSYRGNPYLIGLANSLDLGVMRGAAVVMTLARK